MSASAGLEWHAVILLSTYAAPRISQGIKATKPLLRYGRSSTTPAIVENSPLGVLARLGLARSYALQGDSTKAPRRLLDFLTLWKDADPDIPILKEAKAEYAKPQ